MALASGEAAMQTFVLRVTIHCHGCKKKVRKVLKNIEGVQDVKVDAQLHKVMVTGTVDADTLIKRLHKSGKQALPWQHAPAKNPDPAPPTPAPAEDAAVADKKPTEGPQADSSEKKPGQETASEKKKPEQETASEKKKPETEKEAESEKKADKEEAAKPSDGGEGAAAEPKAKSTEEPASEPAKEAGDDEGEAKKKQSKPKDAAAPAADRSPSPAPAPAHAPPRYAHQEFNAPQPVMSYNMAQPRASVSHYAPQPEQGYSSSSSMMLTQQAYSQQAQPMQQWSPSYLYMPYPHASPESYYQDYYSPPGTHAPPPPPPTPPLHDSYRLFDDENPNSCSVM